MSEDKRLSAGMVLVLVGSGIAVFGLLGLATRERSSGAMTAFGVFLLLAGGSLLVVGDGSPV